MVPSCSFNPLSSSFQLLSLLFLSYRPFSLSLPSPPCPPQEHEERLASAALLPCKMLADEAGEGKAPSPLLKQVCVFARVYFFVCVCVKE